MSVDYPGAVDMIITDPAWVFTDALLGVPDAEKTIVIHKTACNGPCDAASVASYFIQDVADHKSAHFIVGRDGGVVQTVLLKDGAGANCCLETRHDGYWDTLANKYGNLNTCTISIEHVDQTSDNSQDMPVAQVNASLQLIKWLVDRYNLNPLTQIKTHASLDPIDKARCPGPTYPWQYLLNYLGYPTQQGNIHMHQAMLDTWNMYYNNLSKQVGIVLTPPAYTTGIARDWQNWYPRKNFGSPMMYEQGSVNWNGDSIQVQYFTGGIRAEWNNSTNGPTVFYDSQGNTIQ